MIQKLDAVELDDHIDFMDVSETDPNLLRMLDREIDDIVQGRTLPHKEAIKTALRLRKILFTSEAPADPFYSDVNMAMLEKRFADAKAGQNMQEHELVEV